ncbi:Segregation and condensation protein B [bioreactor metagenome]|uniref:Segregation and condensation protein B n=1 Tax=bioreactor metagenome TaxID=1076179 RepID=A0A645AN70_9ZZZZ
MEFSKLEGAIEAILFCSGEPVGSKRLCDVLDVDEKTLKQVIAYMSGKYDDKKSGIMILSLENSYQMSSRGEYADYVRDALLSRRSFSISPAGMEVLSIIAYNQPVTRAYIEQVRGVDCTAVLANLIEKSLVEEAGRLEAPGRPNLYKTTLDFLRVFGINSLSQLPPLPDIETQEEDSEEMTLTNP